MAKWKVKSRTSAVSQWFFAFCNFGFKRMKCDLGNLNNKEIINFFYLRNWKMEEEKGLSKRY